MNILSGYNTWELLVESIDKYLELKTKNNKEYFNYDGVSFINVLGSKLFFDVLLENDLINIQKNISNTNILQKEIYKDILDLMFPLYKKSFVYKKSVKSNIKVALHKKNCLINSYLSLTNKSYDSLQENKYIFIIIHHKFIRYLLDIYKTLANSIFVICSDFEKSIELCKSNQYNYVVLQQYSKIKGNYVKEICDLVVQYESIKYFLQRIKPHVIVIPEGNAYIYEIFNLVSKKFDIKTVCIQHGWDFLHHQGFKNKNYDLFLTWGKAFSKILNIRNPEQTFIEVGSHVLNIENTNKRQESICFLLQGETLVITSEVYESLFLFIEHIAKKYPKLDLIIREHPSLPIKDEKKEKLMDYSNIRFMNNDKYKLSEVLSLSKISVSIYSTVLYESLLYNSIPFIYNLTCLTKFEPYLSDLGVGVQVRSFDEAVEAVDKLLINDNVDIIQRIKEKKCDFFKSYGLEAKNNIIREINKIEN